MKRLLLALIFAVTAFAQQLTFPPTPTGYNCQYFGSSTGATTHYYWTIAVSPFGTSALAGPCSIASLPASLNSNDRVLVGWNSMPGASSYVTLTNTTGATPTGTVTAQLASGFANSATDTGQGLISYAVPVAGTVVSGPTTGSVGLGTLSVAHAIYRFAVDGGTVAAHTLAWTATIPIKAILIGATVNSTTAFTGGAGFTVAVGTTAGSAADSILTATGVGSLGLNAVTNGTVTLAAPVKMSAAGNVNITVGTDALTAGVLEIFVYYTVALN